LIRVIKNIDGLIDSIESENKKLRLINSEFTNDGKWIAIILSDNELMIEKLKKAKQILS
jgi:hypothetical protein